MADNQQQNLIQQLQKELQECKQENTLLNQQLQQKDKIIKDQQNTITNLEEHLKQIQNIHRKSSNQKFASTMDQIPEFDEKKTLETKPQNEGSNSESDKESDQNKKITMLQEPTNLPNSPLQKKISSPLTSSQKKIQESPQTSTNKIRRLSSRSSRKSQKNIGDDNDLYIETYKVRRRKTITLVDSSPENSPLKSEGDTPSKKNKQLFNDVNKEQMLDSVKENVFEAIEIRKQQKSEVQNLEEEEKDKMPSPLIKISDIAKEIQQNYEQNEDQKQQQNQEINNNNKIPLVVNTIDNQKISSSNLSDKSYSSQIRKKSISYNNKDLSQRYVEALKKSIVAISYDVENQDQVEDNVFTELKSPIINMNNELADATPKSDNNQIYFNKDSKQYQKTMGDEPSNTSKLGQFQFKKSSTSKIAQRQSIQFSFQKKRLNSSSLYMSSQQSERFRKQNLQKFGIQYQTQRQCSENDSASIKNQFDSESPNFSPLTQGKKTGTQQEINQQGKLINLQQISNFDSNNQQNSDNHIPSEEQHKQIVPIDKSVKLVCSEQNLSQSQENIHTQQIQHQISHNLNQSSFSSQQSQQSIQRKNDMNLFERFFMIGNDKSVLEEVQDDPNVKDWIVPAKIMYSYPQDKEQTDPIYSIIHDFAFPFGVEIVKLPQKQSIPKQIKEEIIIQGSNPKQMIPRFFYFTIKSEETEQYLYNSEYQDENVNQVYATVNPNRVLYCICLRIKDFFESVVPGNEEQPEQSKFWKLNKVYCFVSKFPFYELFQDIICQLINEIKIQRMGQLAQLDLSKPGELQKIDSDWVNHLLVTQIQQYLKKVQQKFEPQFNFLHNFQGVFGPLSFQIPKSQEAFQKVRQWSIVPTFSNLIIEDFLLILFAILTEKTVIFVSKSQALLTHTIHTFETFLHPFQWPHPIIYCLPESLLEILDSPVPLIIGINQSEAYINSDSIDTRYPNYIFVYLDSQRIYSSNLQQLINIEDSFPNFNNFLMKLRMNYNIINVEAAYNYNMLSQQQEKEKKKKEGFFTKIFDNKSDKKAKSNISPMKSNIRRASYITSDFCSQISNRQQQQNQSDKKKNHQYSQSQQINASQIGSSKNVTNTDLDLNKKTSSQKNMYPIKFFPHRDELVAADLIMHMVHNTLKCCIIDLIPTQLKYNEENLIDFDQVIKDMLSQAYDEDKQFLQIFGKTQIFTYYVETHMKKTLD